eukprot:m.72443 g.72443  ORF g.72443 m.72443 type:complete len:539 (+) comp12328_c0_seq2:87-1703(+)
MQQLVKKILQYNAAISQEVVGTIGMDYVKACFHAMQWERCSGESKYFVKLLCICILGGLLIAKYEGFRTEDHSASPIQTPDSIPKERLVSVSFPTHLSPANKAVKESDFLALLAYIPCEYNCSNVNLTFHAVRKYASLAENALGQSASFLVKVKEILAEIKSISDVKPILNQLKKIVLKADETCKKASNRRFVLAYFLISLATLDWPFETFRLDSADIAPPIRDILKECGHFIKDLFKLHVHRIHHIIEQQHPKRKQRNQGPPVYLLHISKAGGSTLCSLSHYNQCLEHPKANNCWIPGAGPVWFATMQHKECSCDEFDEIIERDKLDLVSNEGYLDGGVTESVQSLCPNMLHMTMVRKPITRVFSHMMQAGVKPAGYSNQEYLDMSIAERINIKPEISSNYMTRMLLGKRAYYSGKHNLTTKDAEQAINLLNEFDVVLVLEETTKVSRLLESLLGWHNASDLSRYHKRKSHHPLKGNKISESDMLLVKKANELDEQIYETATTIFNLDLILSGCADPLEYRHDYFTCHNSNRKYPRK